MHHTHTPRPLEISACIPKRGKYIYISIYIDIYKAQFLQIFLAEGKLLEREVPPQKELVGEGHGNGDSGHPEGLRSSTSASLGKPEAHGWD